MRKILVSLLALGTAATAQAQVLITEVQPNPPSQPDNEEWLEIHNTGAAAVSVEGWAIADYSGTTRGRLYTFPVGTTLLANEVVIVTKQAAAFATSFPGGPVPDFELAIGNDDPTVTNLVAGTGNNLAFGNSGDALVLLDASGTVVSAVHWGSNTAGLSGAAGPNPAQSSSLGRVNNLGTAQNWRSDTDFIVLTTPTPGVGYTGPAPTPPVFSTPTRAPAGWVHGDNFTVSATITDSDGIGGAAVYFAAATSTFGAALSAYQQVTPTNSGAAYSATRPVANPATGVTVPAPTTFHERYIRYFFYALDNVATDAALPELADTPAGNAAFFWENVLPPTAVATISEARVQGTNERPRYEHHSVRIEGIVLTTGTAFISNRANFFIASPTGIDAIRVFDDELLPMNVQPGDRVRVTGKIGVFNGVRQVGRDERNAASAPRVSGSEIVVQVLGTAPVPMQTVTIQQLLAAGETYESSLVVINNVQITDAPAPTTWPSNANVMVSDGTGILIVRTISGTSIVGQMTPMGTFTIRGILSQFAPTGTGGYQLQPRGLEDVIVAPPPVDAGVSDMGVADMGMLPDSGADTGVPDTGAPDTGTETPDTGVETPDTGVGTPDTGVVADTGVTGPDSGVNPADSGVRVDAGPRPDSGVITGGRDEEGGCGCNTAETSSKHASWLGVMMLGMAFVIRRRR